jgi:hypothetical protein
MRTFHRNRGTKALAALDFSTLPICVRYERSLLRWR